MTRSLDGVMKDWKNLERSGLYVVRDEMIITIIEMPRVADLGVRKSSTASFALELVKSFKVSNISIFSALVCTIAADQGKSFPDTELRLTFVKFNYLMKGCIPTIQDVDFDNEFIKEPVKYERIFQRVFATVWYVSFGVKKNRFVWVSGGEEEGSDLWVAKVIQLRRISFRGSNESREFAFLQFMNVSRSIDTMYEPLGFDGLRWGTDDKADHSLRRNTDITEQRDPGVKKWFEMERLKTLQGFVNVVRANHENAPFTERILWHLQRFYLNRFYSSARCTL